MPAKVIVLAEWKASHPPIVRLWLAQSRAAAEWWRMSGNFQIMAGVILV
ncbi:MAG: hypothetical protein H6R14_759 [Proteobacteria bacterium]|nr:hypothetical protein [Pseudomonadota bacterium]